MMRARRKTSSPISSGTAAVAGGRRPRTAERRGVSMLLTLMVTFAVGALSMGAIYLTSNGQLLGKMSEVEKDLRYAADGALQIGKSRLNNDPQAMPESAYKMLVSDGTVMGADGKPIAGVTYNLWAGPTGSTTGQFGHFGSVVAEAVGPRGARFVRRLELLQESFARYAYWSNKEKMVNGSTIVFANGDMIWGPVWSNDYITIHSSGATFNDDVTTAETIVSPNYGTFKKGYRENENPIKLPTITDLAKLPGYAASGSLSFNAPTNGAATTLRMRAEFVAVDLNNDGDSTDVDEGFVRVYEANAAQESWIRGNWTTTKTSANNCGDFHKVLIGGQELWKFFPASVHGTTGQYLWARNLWDAVNGVTTTWVDTHAALTVTAIMSQSLANGQPAHRCFPGGDPHLVAVERNAIGGGATGQIGGDATTFTGDAAAGATKGHWKKWGGAIDPRLAAKRPYDASYLYPIYRGQNPGSKGVIHFNGTVGISGLLRGRVTLYSNSWIVILDDLKYTTDPSGGFCNDMLGVVAGKDIVVADNAINTPQNASGYRNMDDTKDLYVNGVQMAIQESFTVENYDSGPTDANDCEGVNVGRGCLYLLGGLIQERRGAVGLTNGSGFLKRYSYDRCAVQIPPPYFPTTGRFTDNRYSELDPGRFDVVALFKSLTPSY